MNPIDVKIRESNTRPCEHICLAKVSEYESTASYMARLLNRLNEKYLNWALSIEEVEDGSIEIKLVR